MVVTKYSMVELVHAIQSDMKYVTAIIGLIIIVAQMVVIVIQLAILIIHVYLIMNVHVTL